LENAVDPDRRRKILELLLGKLAPRLIRILVDQVQRDLERPTVGRVADGDVGKLLEAQI
jgi:hypothetical protein